MAESDFIRLNLEFLGQRNIRLSAVGLSWPPPARIMILEDGLLREATGDDPACHVMRCIRLSQLTDEQIEGCDGIARGAEYEYLRPDDG